MRVILSLVFIFTFYSVSVGQNVSKLKSLLSQEFPSDSVITTDGRWVFDSETADIQKVNTPLVNEIIPDFSFYKVSLTHYLGYHITKSYCLILYDSKASRIKFIEPRWVSGIKEDFLRLFLGANFDDQESLLKFLSELQHLLNIGTNGYFDNTKYTNAKITFDLIEIIGGSEKIWRNIEVGINENKIVSFKLINPIGNKVRLIE